ncbi:MAG: CoA transferase [Dehalococcoidia bacterium]
MPDQPAALAPYRVLDLTTEIGQYAGRCFAEMGAEVIKIEPPAGDAVRRIGPFFKDEALPDRSLLWFVLNASKKGVTCDLEQPEGRDLFRRLLDGTDIVLESFPPGYLRGLGLDYEALRKEHPKLVWVSITGFGQGGPYRDYKWSDLVGLALGGLLNLWGEAARPPVRARASQAYYHASLGAALGGMLAIYHARRTGAGQHVDVSMQEVVTFTLAGPGGITGFWYLEGRNITRSGTGINLGMMVSRTIYPCKDGHVAVSTLFGPHLPRVIELMKRDGAAQFLEDEKWLKATRFAPLPGQWQCNQDEADAAEDVFEAWLMTHTQDEISTMVRDHELMIFPVSNVPDNLENEQLTARDYFQQIEHDDLDVTITYPGPPVALSETPWRVRGRAPLVGEHNAEIYSALGLSGDEIESLRAKEAI